MSASYLLDTSVFSQPIKDKPDLRILDRWSALGDAAMCTSAVCLAEVLQGLEMRGSDKFWHRYRQLLKNRYPVLAFDSAVAEVFGKLAAELERLGNPRPALDLMIAATAKRHGFIIVTLNAKDFADIPGVAVEAW